LDFVNQCFTPFHVVHWCKARLVEKGFKELYETENWQLEKSGKYFFTRNHSTLVAFDLGKDFDINNTGNTYFKSGFKIVGAHTDSPCLRLAPVSKMISADFHQTCVSTYGGGLWHTWFDRTLRIGGKVVYKNGDNYTIKLWDSKKPLLKIPNLAIHLTTERSKFEPNTETHLRPIISSEIYKQLVKPEPKKDKGEEEKGIYRKHYSALIDLIASDLGINADTIQDFDLYMADSNPAGYFGLNDEYISSPRLDNLFSSFHSLNALIESENTGKYINMVALFDHE
jgi:aspartyl aminopeptidase